MYTKSKRVEVIQNQFWLISSSICMKWFKYCVSNATSFGRYVVDYFSLSFYSFSYTFTSASIVRYFAIFQCFNHFFQRDATVFDQRSSIFQQKSSKYDVCRVKIWCGDLLSAVQWIPFSRSIWVYHHVTHRTMEECWNFDLVNNSAWSTLLADSIRRKMAKANRFITSFHMQIGWTVE